MLYDCPRCGYETDRRTDIEKHILTRKKMCLPNKCAMEKPELVFVLNRMIKEVAEVKTHDCNVYAISAQSLLRHATAAITISNPTIQ